MALTVALAIGLFVLVLGPALILTSPTLLPPPLSDQEQDVESALYLAAFAIILPAALIAAPRLADTIAAGPNAGALSLLAALVVATLAVAILVVRVLPGAGGVVEALSVVGVWWLGAMALLARATRTRPWARLLRVAPLAPVAWGLAGALVLGALLAFTSLGSISPLPVALGAVAVPATLFVYARGRTGLPPVPRRWGVAIDALIIVLCVLAIPDLVIFGSDSPFGAATNPVIQFHHDFFLGPVNEVLHGGTVLVDTASQYGVGSLYFLAGWFELAPIGYGTLGFLDGALFGLFFAAAYCVLRIAGTPRLLAGGGVALGVVALIHNLEYSVGSLPQHGPLRFGLPMVVILAATAEDRWPRRARIALASQLFAVALSSVWALEAFAYTAATFAVIACFRAWALPGQKRLKSLLRTGAVAVAACAIAHVLLAAATLAAAGRLPDWGQYLAYLNEFLFGGVGDITYDFSHWSAGLPVGAAYLASAAAIVLVVRRRRDIVDEHRAALTALCGASAYGIALFSYFVNRSADHILPYVSLPALMVGILWLSLLLRGALAPSRALRIGGLAFALSVAVLLVSVAWSSIGPRVPRTAVAHVVPGGDSLGGTLDRLWNPAPIDPRTPQGEALVSRYLPGTSPVPIVAAPDLETEILLRSGRAHGLGLSYATEDSFVPEENLPHVQRAVDELQPGDRLLMQAEALEVLAAYRAQPSRDPLTDPVDQKILVPLQEWALERIAQRFRVRVIHRDKGGFVVVALRPG
ncbi:MAG: hypothetical protein AABM66_02320 [Actinomycetota bacterium]